jgi:hypothetical protein
LYSQSRKKRSRRAPTPPPEPLNHADRPGRNEDPTGRRAKARATATKKSAKEQRDEEIRLTAERIEASREVLAEIEAEESFIQAKERESRIRDLEEMGVNEPSIQQIRAPTTEEDEEYIEGVEDMIVDEDDCDDTDANVIGSDKELAKGPKKVSDQSYMEYVVLTSWLRDHALRKRSRSPRSVKSLLGEGRQWGPEELTRPSLSKRPSILHHAVLIYSCQ